jgi:tetratricopeptide (TPR) repeat protein
MVSHDRGVLLTKARSLLAAGRLAEAEQMCIQLLSRNHSDVDALSLKCAVSVQHGSLEIAETLSARCVSLQPRNASFLFQLGKVRAAQGRHRDAIVQFEKALEVDPTMSMTLVAKAESLNFLGETEEAAKLLQPLMAAGQESAHAALLYATLSQQAGRYEDAAALATRHLANPALDGPVRVRLGLLAGRSFEQLDDIDRSFDAYRQANSIRATYSRFDRESASHPSMH